MARRRHLGCLLVVALACAGMACKDKAANNAATNDVPATPTATVDLDKRCTQLGKICGDKAKHVEKIIAECKQATKQACLDQAIAAYDCYEKELCNAADKVWTIEDLGKLAERRNKCVAEQEANRACAGSIE